MNTFEAAKQLGVHPRTVYSAINAGRLRARWKFHTGYIITPQDIRDYQTRQSSWPRVRTPLIDALVGN